MEEKIPSSIEEILRDIRAQYSAIWNYQINLWTKMQQRDADRSKVIGELEKCELCRGNFPDIQKRMAAMEERIDDLVAEIRRTKDK